MPGQGFGRDCRLLTAQEFADVFAARKTLRGTHFVLHFRRGTNSMARLGLVIPKKQARAAVLRNAIKRQARELFRRQRSLLPPVDLVVRLARAGNWNGRSADPRCREHWRTELQGLLERLVRTDQTAA